ncbi:MAG TPA: hypothetical protein VF606_10840, partial [Geminicoccaceae bacterium]
MHRLTMPIAAALLAHLAAAPALADGTTTRVSVGPRGEQADDASFSPSLSANGRFVAFNSAATNLAPGTVGRLGNIFVRDRRTGTNELISRGLRGVRVDDSSFDPIISADGRFVAFASRATNLVAGDTNDLFDVFLHDRRTGRTTRVNLGPRGAQDNGGAQRPALSADGRVVVFLSGASNLVPGDTNGHPDVFAYERATGRVTRVNVGPGGAAAEAPSYNPPSISGNGRYVAFDSAATNLVPGTRHPRFTKVFVHDRATGRTELASVGPGGVQADRRASLGSISPDPDGRYVAFSSEATNLVPGFGHRVQVFVHDRKTGGNVPASLGWDGAPSSQDAVQAKVSADGRVVAFSAYATGLVPGDDKSNTEIFVRDRDAGTTERAAAGPGGVVPNSGSRSPALSADGRFVAFD